LNCEYFDNIVGISQSKFLNFVEELEKNNKQNDHSKFSLKDKMLLTLIRLRCCLSYRFLSWLFGISISSVAKYIQETLEIIHKVDIIIFYFF
jgi:hypothetical protein